MSTIDDKFSLYFKPTKLDVNDDKNPTLVELQNNYYNCNQKLNDFNQQYKTKYNDLFTILNQKSLDEDLIKSTINELNSFVNDSQQNINECYKSILGKQKTIMGYNNNKLFNNSDVKSVIQEIQEETNQKYNQYQKDILVLQNYQKELEKTIHKYNSMNSSLNDGLLTQTYTLLYIWFIILIIIVVFCFINILNMNLGAINNVLLIFTVLVALYFVYSNLKIYFV
tara:strand:+ start:63 stop:737 length:675 start_codon:yes stop_codon:yes gene_type:complete